MTGAELARVDTAVDPLVYLGLDPKRIEVRVLFLLCQRYHLDLILGHARLIPVKGAASQPYITRDGMLHVAHDSGQLDGMIVDEQRESENGYSATVSVWRKDMAHPFTYKGGCGKAEPQAQAGNGAAMALARAERRALRRAFDLPAYDGDEPIDAETGEITPPAPGPEKGEPPDSRGIASPAPHLATGRPGPPLAISDPDGSRQYKESPFRRKQQPPPTPPTPAVEASEPPPGGRTVVVSTPARPPAAPKPGYNPNAWRDGSPMFDEHGKQI